MLSYHIKFESSSTLLSLSSLWSSWLSSSVMSKASIDLFWLHLIVSWKVFQLVFISLVYNSVLFLASCCCSFLLHLISNLICIFLVSCQLVVLATLPKYLHSFCGQKGCTLLFFWKISTWFMLIVKTSNLT
jgi:hypothetical protein